ncbi:hypothetical protein C8R44DRAFT_645801, partial [Mycena epipterygia]
ELPTDGPVIIIIASFELREPADTTVRFINWLRNLNENELEGVRFTISGAETQKISTLCDELFEKHGGPRLMVRVWGDASKAEFSQMFDEFEARLWTTLSKVS